MDETNNTETFRLMQPHLQTISKFLAKQTPRFIEVLDAFLACPVDVTGLRVYNLRTMAQDLKKDYEIIDGLLSRLDKYQEEPVNDTSRHHLTNEHQEQELDDFDLDAFDRLCEQAYAALDNAGKAVQAFKLRYAKEQGVDPERIQILIKERPLTLISIIRPPTAE